MPGYAVERSDRLNAGKGGLVTLIKNGIAYSVLPSIVNIESLSIKVHMTDKDIIICNVYNTSATDLRQNIDSYKKLFEYKNAFIIGDFNSFSPMWGSPHLDKNGELIEELLDDYNLALLNTGVGPFIKRTGGLSHLDLSIAASEIAIKCNWSVHEDCLGSDHFPIVIRYNERPVIEDPGFSKWAIKRADWVKYKNCCATYITPEVIKDDVLDFSRTLSDAILRAARESIPVVTIKERPKTVPYWNKQCDDAIKARNRAQRKARLSQDINDACNFRRLRGVAQRVLKNKSRDHWESYCSTLNSSTKLSAVWRMSKKMLGNKSSFTIPTLKSNNKSYITNADKANLIAEVLPNASSDKNYTEEFVQHRQNTEHVYKQEHPDLNDDCEINENFTSEELKKALKQCKNETSPGLDNITYEMVKNIPPNSQ